MVRDFFVLHDFMTELTNTSAVTQSFRVQLAKDMRTANSRGEELGLSEDEVAFYDALETNDSYHFFEALDGLIRTGPTGTNVNDLLFILVS